MSARDVCLVFPKYGIFNNLFHTEKQSFREQVVYLYDRCVLPSDEHKSLPLLIKDDLRGTGSDFLLQRLFWLHWLIGNSATTSATANLSQLENSL